MTTLIDSKQSVEKINKFIMNKSLGLPYDSINNASTEEQVIIDKREDVSLSVKYEDITIVSNSVETPKSANLAINQKRKSVIDNYCTEILNVIQNDVFEDGEISKSEIYILENFNDENGEYIKTALMKIFEENYGDEHILTGVLTMISAKSFEEMEYQGPIIPLALLQHEDIYLRDKAIQTYEIWNSKKGIPILERLHCDQKWLQDYVNDVIFYLKRDGVD